MTGPHRGKQDERPHTLTLTLTPKDNLETPINLTCMFLDGGRKPVWMINLLGPWNAMHAVDVVFYFVPNWWTRWWTDILKAMRVSGYLCWTLLNQMLTRSRIMSDNVETGRTDITRSTWQKKNEVIAAVMARLSDGCMDSQQKYIISFTPACLPLCPLFDSSDSSLSSTGIHLSAQHTLIFFLAKLKLGGFFTASRKWPSTERLIFRGVALI